MINDNSSQPVPKVALVYDHVTTPYGGAELVLQILHELFPDAPLYTTVFDKTTARWASALTVHTSFLQKIPLLQFKHQLLAPLHPVAFEGYDLSDYDIVISVTSGAAKGVITHPQQLHVCYLLTPTRYLLGTSPATNTYVASQKLFLIPGLLQLLRPLFSYLKRWDTVAAWRPDKLIAISKLVSERAETEYNRKADDIVYPPFVFKSPLTKSERTTFLLCLTRLVGYKKIENAIQAAKKLQQLLIIAGNGPFRNTLLSQARNQAYQRNENESLEQALATSSAQKKTIVFLSSCTEKEKQYLLSQCSALLMPGEEDFGLTGLEAASYGKPVITHYRSGIAEILEDKTHAIHLKTGSVEELIEAIQFLDKHRFNPEKLIQTARKHEVEHFKNQFQTAIYQFWQQHSTISPVKRS